MRTYTLIVVFTCFTFLVHAQVSKTLSVIGSSTSACFGFPGGVSDANCYVNRLVNYYNANGYSIELHNLAVSGSNIYNGMPTGSPPVTIGGAMYAPNPNANITKAISFDPDVIIVNYPTNTYDVADVHAILSYFRAVKKNANDSGRICFVTTTQPRNFDATGRAKLMELKDSILLQFGFFAINFWDELATSDGLIKPEYNQGDGVHMNAAGHDTLFHRVLAKNIFAVDCINRTVANGNWNNPAIWDKGIIPEPCDSVVVAAGHALTVNISATVKSLFISAGSSISVGNAGVTLTVSEPGLFNKQVIGNGTLNLSAGKIIINGRLQQNAGSSFNMTGGELIIDGNNGSVAGSVSNGTHLFDIAAGAAAFSFTGGTLQIIDPPLGSSSQAVDCSFNFGAASTLKFGNGISTTASNNVNGFGGNLLPAQIGRLIIDAATSSNNRHFINLNAITVKSPLQVLSGTIRQQASFTVAN